MKDGSMQIMENSAEVQPPSSFTVISADDEFQIHCIDKK